MKQRRRDLQDKFSDLLTSLGGAGAVKRLAGPGLASMVIKTLGAILGYVMMIAFARLLNNEDYGKFGVMLNAAVVGNTLVALGLPM